MCGIAGLYIARNADASVLSGIGPMTEALRRRGPDGSGLWSDDRIAFGHRRLSVIDLSPAGAQPMASASGRFILTYNGELYNTEELQAELAARGVTFRGTSDTEALVNAIELWGIDRTLEKINGIFAFGCWDREEKRLFLARDRFGVKPLFWSRIGGAVAFGSELRALALVPGFERVLDPKAIGSLLQYNYIRSPLSIYKTARSLPAGCVATVEADGVIREKRYWDFASIVREGAATRAKPVNDRQALDELEALIGDAVRRQLVSDVPIGAFLSGGIDSSLVVSMMQQVATRKVRSFSIGFEVPELNEAERAAEVARALGTDHTELYVTEKEALACVPQMASIYDQPLADPSNIPTYLLCKLAREHVTVALSGDGGDEMFFGYERFGKARAAYDMVRRIPRAARRLGFLGIDMLRHDALVYANDDPSKIARAAWHAGRLLGFAQDDPANAYLHLITHWPQPGRLVPGAGNDVGAWRASAGVSSDYAERLMYHDATSYMTDGVLAKVDRASMFVALEARVPLLDHRIAEMAWRLPFSLKYRDGVSKWALREILYRHVPRALVDRPKSGFGAPIGRWLRGPLRDWADSYLSERALADGAIVDPAPVRRLWAAHTEGRIDAAHQLWSILQLQAWIADQRAAPAVAPAVVETH